MKFGSVKHHGHAYVLFESLFCLTKLLSVAMVRSVEVVLGQTLNHSV
jgi:hypothetical protein